MSRIVAILALVILAASCGSKKVIPEGAPPKTKEKALIEKIGQNTNAFKTLRFKSNAKYNDGSSSQSFRLEVRMIKDSLIWADVADPFLGIKVARAIIYKDSLAFYNKLEREYYAGNLRGLTEKLNFDFGFEDLQDILSGNRVIDIDRSFDLFYRKDAYLLANFDADGNDNDSIPKAGQIEFNEVYISPDHFKPLIQLKRIPTQGMSYVIWNNNIQDWGNFLFPKQLKVEYTQNQTSGLSLEIKSLETNKPTSFPFNIPSGYAKMR